MNAELEKIVEFAVDEIQKIKFDDYDSEEFAIARMGFLSTRPNSHGLVISEEVLREYAPSVLGKWVVAKMQNGDATTHRADEVIMGNIPRDQEVEFVYDDDGYLRAYVDAVISKIYAKQYCKMFEEDNERSVSVEMKIATTGGEGMNDIVEELNIVGVTTLGKNVNPSCPESDITFVRFSEDEAKVYFNKVREDSLATLKNFIKERKFAMEEKNYKIDKSKEAISMDDWGSIDKVAMRDKIMEASNRDELVKEVYLLVEDGWEEAPSEHLKYPVFQLKEDTFVYNREALSSALAYAKQHEETSVVNKVEQIYKDLDLEDSEGKEEEKMAEIEFAAVNIGDLWGRLWSAIDERREWDYCLHEIYEEDNQKFALLKDREGNLYRLDFSLTEEGLKIADEIVKVEVEIVETDVIRKFAEPENVEQYRKFAEKEPEVNVDELMAKIAKLEADIEERDNIIMGKDVELEELRGFKKACMEAERAKQVESVMASVAKFMDKDTIEKYRQEGLNANFAEVDAWANKVKASVVDKALNSVEKNVEFTRISGFTPEKKVSNSVWDRL